MVLWMIVSYMISLLFYAMWHSTHVLASPLASSTYTFSNTWGSDMKDDDETGEIVDLVEWKEMKDKEKMREELDELWEEFIHVTDQLAAYGDAGSLKESLLHPLVDLRHELHSATVYSDERRAIDFDDAWDWYDYEELDEEREPDT